MELARILHGSHQNLGKILTRIFDRDRFSATELEALALLITYAVSFTLCRTLQPSLY